MIEEEGDEEELVMEPRLIVLSVDLDENKFKS